MSDDFHLLATLQSRSPAETDAMAARLAAFVSAGDVLALTGDLGAGKSQFARSFVRTKMADSQLDVPSPTFTIVQIYTSDTAQVAHADLYRLHDQAEVAELGFDDLLQGGPLLVEWPDKLPVYLQMMALLIRFEMAHDGTRVISFYGMLQWQSRLTDFLVPAPAMLLAAGRGTRMGAVSEHTPKPLVPVLGRTLLDRALDRLREAAALPAVVNVHHLPAHMLSHLGPLIAAGDVLLSDEQDDLLETGGGVVRAQDKLADIFAVINSDALWLDGPAGSAIAQLRAAFDMAHMDVLLLLVPMDIAMGAEGAGDYDVATIDEVPAGVQAIRSRDKTQPDSRADYLYGGIMITHKGAYNNAPLGAFSNKVIFDAAEKQGRLYGLVHDGRWMHVGTPEGLAEAEKALTHLAMDDDHD